MMTRDGTRDVDFGIVVGVEHYPYYEPLHGAAEDAEAFLAWLRDKDGGGLRKKNVQLILSNLARETPVQDEIDRRLVKLLDAACASKRARRLYFYFSGHGAANRSSKDDVALLLTRWSRSLAKLALSTELYSHALRGAGLFEEVAIFVDCCRSLSEQAVGVAPTITGAWATSCTTNRFIAFASEPGQPAYSARIAGPRWEGIFTRCLLAILRREPAGVSASALKDYLEIEVEMEAMRAGIRQRARAENGFLAESCFGRAGQPPVLTLVFVKRRGTVTLKGGKLQIIATHEADRVPWRLRLPVGLYMLEGGNAEPVYFVHDGTGQPRNENGVVLEL